MTEQPTWVISDVELREVLKRAHAGESPQDLVAELYAAATVEDLAHLIGEG